jgi:DNA modification methylase
MTVRIIIGDVREKLAELPDESVHCVVTSPPYFGLRDYGVAGQIGLEPTPAEFVAVMVEVFREVRRVLRKDGTLWLNLGDSYHGNGLSGGDGSKAFGGTRPDKIARQSNLKSVSAPKRESGVKPKDLLGIPWRVAFALQADGWYLRQDIIWAKPNPMPESVTDRCTKAHEYLFLLSKSARYHYDAEAIAEAFADERQGASGVNSGVPEQYADAAGRGGDQGLSAFRGDGKAGRNRRSVWTVATQPFKEAHFATFPPDLIKPCIKAGCPKGGTVLDPFGGAGTTGLVADRLQRDAILIELNPAYAVMMTERITDDAPLFTDVETQP